MNVKQRLEQIKNECHGGLGSRTIEPDKTLRLIGELCNVLLEISDESEAEPTREGPDEVEARHRGENEVTRGKRGKQ